MPIEAISQRVVNIRRLKDFALEKLKSNSPLRDVILSEPDQLTASDFLAKLHIWLRLLKFEGSHYIDSIE